jgi:hypothetical protein
MKAIGFMLLALTLTACSHTSRFASDPRAAVVGSDYLDSIEENPRDLDTQFYYPAFTTRTDGASQPQGVIGAAIPATITSLMIDIPQPSQSVHDSAGKGYPELERDGIPLFTSPDARSH